MVELEQIAKAIQAINQNVGDVLFHNLEIKDFETFGEVVANFIKLNY